MELTVYNPQKGRLETLDAELTDENTTWFNGSKDGDVLSVTDYHGGLLIKNNDHSYPVWVYDLSREAIGYSRKKAQQIVKEPA